VRVLGILMRRLIGAVIVILLGVAFFFTIVGVFGLPAAIIGLVLFIALALLITRRAQAEGDPP
jgi:hypothetical protein